MPPHKPHSEPERPPGLSDIPDILVRLTALQEKTRNLENKSDPLYRQRIMDDRARRLKHDFRDRETSAELRPVLVFRLSEINFALDLNWVSEIRRLSEICPLPGVPDFVRGVINVRSRICSVVDLARVLKLPLPTAKASLEDGTAESGQLLLLAAGEMEFAVLIDHLLGVRQMNDDDFIENLPDVLAQAGPYIKGVGRDDLILLDGHQLLNDPALLVDQTPG